MRSALEGSDVPSPAECREGTIDTVDSREVRGVRVSPRSRQVLVYKQQPSDAEPLLQRGLRQAMLCDTNASLTSPKGSQGSSACPWSGCEPRRGLLQMLWGCARNCCMRHNQREQKTQWTNPDTCTRVIMQFQPKFCIGGRAEDIQRTPRLWCHSIHNTSETDL